MRTTYTVMMRAVLSAFLLFALTLHLESQSFDENRTKLLIRVDDIGMSHSVNSATVDLIKSGISFSASVMFACPWYQEAVEILKDNPEVSVGIHLTLNAEWKNYRWGPVAGRDVVSSLVDEEGFFFPSRALFFANNPKTEEIEIELRAQIERALRSGLRIDYLDHHMGTAVETPELRQLLERLASEYELGISRYFGEATGETIYAVSPEEKLDSLITIIDRLETGRTHLLVFHIGMDTPELQAMKDLNPFGLDMMSTHRQSELRALISPDFRRALERNNITPVTYREVIDQVGLQSMKYIE